MGTEVESGKPTDTAAQVTDPAAKPAEGQTQTTDAKPADAPADIKPADAKPADTKPVEYQPFKVPDGAKPSEAVIGKFTDIAKEAGLSQDAAQKFINELAPLIAKENSGALAAQLAEMRKGWIEAAKVDKELGGEKFDENVGIAASVFTKYGTPALKELLDKSGIGDHPEMIRWAHKIAKATGEDKVVQGQLSAGTPNASPESVLYDAPKTA